MDLKRNSFLYWFPKVMRSGLPVPKTECLKTSWGYDFWSFLDKGFPTEFKTEAKCTAARVGYPLFLRTDYLSGKHEGIPFVAREDELMDHIWRLLEDSASVTTKKLPIGFPIHALIFREMLDLEHYFKAFRGLPIARERRYFINNGVVVCSHPYWQENSIRFWRGYPEPAGWKEQLKALNRDPGETLGKMAFKIAYVFREEGYWSVDFAKTRHDGWVLIDMAVGYDSSHPECAHKLPRPKF